MFHLTPARSVDLRLGCGTWRHNREPLKQASGYGVHYGIDIHLVNFWLEGNSVPQPGPPPDNVKVVNIIHNASCSAFEVSTCGRTYLIGIGFFFQPLFVLSTGGSGIALVGTLGTHIACSKRLGLLCLIKLFTGGILCPYICSFTI